ncbi:MAG: outer membrane protein assembly factor BamE [Planctomycetota bacterium]
MRGIAVAALFLLVSCGGRVTQENLDRIQVGMSVSEVEDILGSPDDVSTGAQNVNFGPAVPTGPFKTMVWRKGDAEITVVFGGGRVNHASGHGF